MKSTRKRLAEMQIPRTSLVRWMKNEGYHHAYQPTTIKLSNTEPVENVLFSSFRRLASLIETKKEVFSDFFTFLNRIFACIR
ncbi:hypothetical protein C0J52_27820, partial [Blattella germanica]